MSHICHGRKFNLVESPIGLSAEINLVESPIGVFTLRKESPILEIWVLSWGLKSNKLIRYPNLRDLGIALCTRM